MRYYSLQRPIDIGTIPRSAKIVEVHNFDERRYCKEVERLAWGYVDVEDEISHADCIHYDLAPDGEIPWVGKIWTEVFGVGIKVHEGYGGHILADRSCKPSSGRTIPRYGSRIEYDANGHGTLVETVSGCVRLEYFENEDAAKAFLDQRNKEVMGGVAA